MISRWPISISLAMVAASVALFLAGGHFAASSLIESQQMRQLGELSEVALRRSEASVAYAGNTLAELTANRQIGCDAASLQAVRLHVYRRGAVKDIRVVDGHATVLCSAYSETLEFDKGWVTREQMLATTNPSLSLFKVEQFYGTALGVMRSLDARNGLIAILGVNGSLFDIMPEELREHSDVYLQLADGQTIAHSAPDDKALSGPDIVTLSAASQTYPLRAVIQVERTALAGWNREPYLPIIAVSGLLGAVFGALFARTVARPRTPIEELDRAITAHEFKPYYQPLFNLESGRIVGAEMLARWARADGTVTPPARFIELAEDSGRIEAITWQLLAQSLSGMQAHLRANKDFKLSVNIAPRQFVAAGFVEELIGVVADADVAPSQITLEITEREGFEDLAHATTVVAALRMAGFKVALDDVGIGHSGLSHIERLGVDTLKVDKFFIDRIGRDASADIVVEMLVRLSQELHMDVVAEGIERSEQATALLACGVRQGQGYLVSPPVPLPAFMQLVALRGGSGPKMAPKLVMAA